MYAYILILSGFYLVRQVGGAIWCLITLLRRAFWAHNLRYSGRRPIEDLVHL